jgi:hypothetical protein
MNTYDSVVMSHSVTDDILNGLHTTTSSRGVTGNTVMNKMRRDSSAFQIIRGRTDYDADNATHTKNYFLVIIFHKDVETRPCRPVVRLITLAKPPDTLEDDIACNPLGSAMTSACQLCDASLNSVYASTVDESKLLCIYALSITDQEAVDMTNNISRVNTTISRNSITLTERSNMLLMPTVMHRYIPQGATKILHIQEATSMTDSQISIILLSQSLNTARSLSVKLRALHTYLATPESLHDSVVMFMRKLDITAFKGNAFKFMTL